VVLALPLLLLLLLGMGDDVSVCLLCFVGLGWKGLGMGVFLGFLLVMIGNWYWGFLFLVLGSSHSVYDSFGSVLLEGCSIVLVVLT
jgi:hypothetical protein